MKILEIIPSLHDGGAERIVVDLSNEFLNLGHEVILVSLFALDKKQFLFNEVDEKIRIIELNKKLGFDISIIIKLYKLIKLENPNVVHTHLRSFDYIIFSMFFSKFRFFHTIHNDAFRECPSSISRKLRNRIFRSKKCIPITISKESSSSYQIAYRNIFNYEIINGRSIANPSFEIQKVQNEIESYKKTKKTKVFVNVASISPQKNQEMLVSVFNDLIRSGYDIVLLIVGTERDKVIAEKIKAIKNVNIHLLGTKQNPVDYLICADAFCLSSLYEGMPISIIEAFQKGCIPICTPVGGVKNMIQHGENGFLAKEITEASYKNVLNEFLSVPKERLVEISNNCIKTFNKKYHISLTASNYLQLFSKFS